MDKLGIRWHEEKTRIVMKVLIITRNSHCGLPVATVVVAAAKEKHAKCITFEIVSEMFNIQLLLIVTMDGQSSDPKAVKMVF